MQNKFCNSPFLFITIIKNDAATIKEINKLDNASYALYVQLKTYELIANGTRLENLDNSLLYLPNENELKNAMFTSIATNYPSKYIYKKDFNRAYEIIKYLLNDEFIYTPLTKILLEGELGFISIINNKMEDLENIFTKENLKYIQMLKTEISAQRILYAYYLLYKKDFDKAKKIKENINKHSKNILKGIRKDEFELIDLIESRANFI